MTVLAAKTKCNRCFKELFPRNNNVFEHTLYNGTKLQFCSYCFTLWMKFWTPYNTESELREQEDFGRKNALDTHICSYNNCYNEIYGVVMVPFCSSGNGDDDDDDDDDDGGGGNDIHQYYVNTPLCKNHYQKFAAVHEHVWCKDDQDDNYR